MNKFKKAKEPFAHKYGDHMSILKIYNKYLKLKDNNDNLKNWGYESFLKLPTLEKSNKYFSKLYYHTKGVLANVTKIEIPKLMEYDDEYRILAAIAYGYKLNVAFYKENDKSYNTNYMNKVQLSKDSFLNFSDKPKKEIFYNELFISNGKNDLTITSVIPKKSAELIEQIKTIQ
jgi:hypothetical protein